MLANPSLDIPVKPRVLIADDSRIVRASLIKHIEGLFDFREALDGEQAWETLLIDPSIRIVITDLSMPKLDGYGLLQRIRSSKIGRIRSLPVVVVSGSDEQAERDRAKAAGATDLITKGIDTAQLLSRLDILSKLVNTQQAFERSLELMAKNAQAAPDLVLSSLDTLEAQAEVMLESATRLEKNFVILNICIGLKHNGLAGTVTAPPVSVVNAVGQMLQRTVRQTDVVASTGKTEFTIATGCVQFDAARRFAQRICRAITGANLVRDEHMSFVASCGLISLSDYGGDATASSRSLSALREVAHQRALLGLNQAASGVVGQEEEAAFRKGTATAPVIVMPEPAAPDDDAASPDLPTLLKWIKEGKQDQVLPHMGKLTAELRPLIDFMLQQTRR